MDPFRSSCYITHFNSLIVSILCSIPAFPANQGPIDLDKPIIWSAQNITSLVTLKQGGLLAMSSSAGAMWQDGWHGAR